MTDQEKIDTALQLVETHTGFSHEDLKDKPRNRELVEARHIFFWIVRSERFGNTSYAVMGKAIGKDHATALHGIRSITNLLETDIRLCNLMRDICHDAIQCGWESPAEKFVRNKLHRAFVRPEWMNEYRTARTTGKFDEVTGLNRTKRAKRNKLKFSIQ